MLVMGGKREENINKQRFSDFQFSSSSRSRASPRLEGLTPPRLKTTGKVRPEKPDPPCSG